MDAPVPSCKVCGAATAAFGVVDFNRSCEEARGLVLPVSGQGVDYVRCIDCGLIFTADFDGWTPADFAARIYNDGYAEVDPDFLEVRPRQSAALVAQAFSDRSIRVLDYGGGTGRFKAELSRRGFGAVSTFDPIYPSEPLDPEARFDLVTCFETLEHSPTPQATLIDLASRLASPGLVLFTTLVQPNNIAEQGVGWGYIGPRNGHITLFSADALYRAWAVRGFTCVSFNQSTHAAYRSPPPFARDLLARAGRFRTLPLAAT